MSQDNKMSEKNLATMHEHELEHERDEIDLLDLMKSIWSQRGLIVGIMIIAVLAVLSFHFTKASFSTTNSIDYPISISFIKENSFNYPSGVAFSPRDLITSDVLQNTIALAAFIPVIIGMGGNIGTQSSTIIVRGLATGRVGFENSAKILFKEIRVGLILGILYGILLGLFAIFRFLEISPILGLVVGLSICASMLIAATIGSLVPLILDRFDIDPAVATGPFVTTAIDILGVALYFWIAGALFNLA